MQKGHCLCGDVQYEFDETKVGFGLHCHCKDCQRVTGSGKATVILFPLDAVSISGEYKTFAHWVLRVHMSTAGFVPRAVARCSLLLTNYRGRSLSKRVAWRTPVGYL
jgi:hypothetical protein